jgi:4-amino-4-deoxy-L-arabinose transferase-like glycosyltransferase
VWILLALAVCASLAARLIRAAGSGLWRDEGLFLFVAGSPTIGDLVDFLRLHDSHPPLFYLLMRLWRAAFGQSVAAAQALPVLLGVALVPAAYLVGTRMFSRRAGLIAAILTAVWPSLVYHSVLIRPYSLLPLLGLVSAYYFWSGLRGDGRLAWTGYVLIMLAMLFTHNWSWVFLAAHWVAASVWFAWFRGPWETVRGWALAQVGLAVGYAPWLPVFLYQARNAGHHPLPSASLYNRITSAVPLLNSALSPFVWPARSALLATSLAAAAVWLYRRRDRRPDLPQGWWAGALLMAALPLVAWAIALALSAKTNMLHVRCLVITTPCLLIAVAQVLAALSPPGRWALPSALVLMLVLADLRVVAIKTRGVRSNAREMAAAVAAQVRPSDLVVLAPEYLASSFNLYFRPDNPQIDYPHEERSEAVWTDHQPERSADPRTWERVKARLDQACREDRRVWLVVARDHISDDVPEADTSLTGSVEKGEMKVVWLRANQLRRYLIGLYGPADLEAVPPDPRVFGGGTLGSESECLDVLLFAPPKPGSPPRAARSRIETSPPVPTLRTDLE